MDDVDEHADRENEFLFRDDEMEEFLELVSKARRFVDKISRKTFPCVILPKDIGTM